jgi:hypothetical protein
MRFKQFLGATATIFISFTVPVIVEVKPLAGNKVQLRANTPVVITGELSHCTGSLKAMPLDVICDVNGTVTLTPL